jgi:hypothetical protein
MTALGSTLTSEEALRFDPALRPTPGEYPARQLELLLLSDFNTRTAATVSDHVNSFGAFSRHHVRRLSMLGEFSPWVDLARFDGVIIHYTLDIRSDYVISPAARARLRAFTGLKAVFIQDEHRLVDRTIAALRDLGVDLLFTCVPEGEIAKVYSPQALPGLKKVNVLTGYVPTNLLGRATPARSERPIDIGYRGRQLPAHLGRLAQEKSQIADRVADDAPRYGLATDISCREQDRLYGAAWIDFMLRCKAMLGVESGASVFDFTGDLERQVKNHLRRRPDATYEEIERLYLAEHEGKIRLNQISPRCFEAAALRTLMILYEGDYSGILQPWRHYVPLKKDHSNMTEVAAILRDPATIADITERAYQEIALDPRYSYATAVAMVDDAIEAVICVENLSRKTAYSTSAFRLARLAGVKAWSRRFSRWLLSRRVSRQLFVHVALGWMPEHGRQRVLDRIRRWRGIETAG